MVLAEIQNMSYDKESVLKLRCQSPDMGENEMKYEVRKRGIEGGIYLNDQEILKLYTSMVPFLSEVCGPGSEIVIHDVTNPSHSVIAIANNTTGRKIGSPMTDLAIHIKESGGYNNSDYIASYIGKTSNKRFLSSTYFIKNKERLIGLLCINKDLSILESFQAMERKLLLQFGLMPANQEDVTEDLENPVENMLHTLISDTITQMGIPVSRMSLEEKVQIVHRLNEQGVLRMKGAIAEIAVQLGISEPTVYRYLNRTPKSV